MKLTKTKIALAISLMASGSAFANTFVNGSFETGDATGWTEAGSSYRASVGNSALTPAFVIANDLPSSNGGGVHSSIIASGTVDPNVGAAFGTTVYSGNYSYRVEDTTSGGYASLIQQQVLNYTDPDIFFAWKSVLLGAHGPDSAATMKIVLHDDTDSVDLITREYNAASGGGGVDARFSTDGSNFYTADWQIEQLTLGAAAGHDFTLSVLASDCQPTGHWGYVYLDGFGAVTPPSGVPEPETLALMGLGLLGLGAARRRKSA